ncbi:hypothetical protein IAT38_001699 [Cryptococcus sp. DSM 104549]
MAHRYPVPHSSSPAPSTTLPASLSHFVIFNPSLRPPPVVVDPEAERDKDEEDDVREAAQILFYTSREAGGVSRDRMLRQVGLAKGLMGFADMLATEEAIYWSIHSHRSRLILYSPEPDFFIYIDPVPAAQGISDQALVDALSRGYEDFRLLHGPLFTHVPPTPSTSSLLDKYFTRFSLNFESSFISSPLSISTCLGGFPASPIPSLEATASSFFTNLDSGSQLYIIGKDGPLSIQSPSADPALTRYLVQLVQASLPPPPVPDDPPASKFDGRQTLGFGLSGLGLGRRKKEGSREKDKKEEERKASWVTLGGWVPDLRRVSSPAPSLGSQAGKDGVQPGNEGEGKPSQSAGTSPTKDGKNKWGFGLGGLGDAVGSVGTVFGLGGPGKETEEAAKEVKVGSGNEELGEGHTSSVQPDAPGEEESTPTLEQPLSAPTASCAKPADIPLPTSATPSITGDAPAPPPTKPHLEPADISLPELEEAVKPDVELEWDSRVIWVPTTDGSSEERRLCWIIRGGTMISIVLDDTSSPPYPLPSTQATLELFAEIASALDTAKPVPEALSTPNAWIGKIARDTVEKQGEMDAGTAQTMVELRGQLKSSPAVTEIFAKASTSRFVVAKQTAQSELYLLVGKKDTSLTDAEHTLRGLSRSRPELGG